jgi:sulfur-oxidizing protein SoxY
MSNIIINKSNGLERRDILRLLGLGTVAIAAGSIINSEAMATPQATQKYLEKLSGSSAYKASKMTIKMPTIAENGAVVPVTVSVESPMTAGNYVKSIHVAAEKNPNPEVASFHLTPSSGKAEISTRMRLGKTQNVVAVAVMNDGSVHRVSRLVKVTIGGCGG